MAYDTQLRTCAPDELLSIWLSIWLLATAGVTERETGGGWKWLAVVLVGSGDFKHSEVNVMHIRECKRCN